MKNLMMILTASVLIVSGQVRADDWDDAQIRIGDDPVVSGRLDDCAADFVVSTIPYHNSSTLVGAVNDCAVRSSEDHIYRITIAVAGEYTFSLCGSTSSWDSRLYLKTTCCSGPSVATNDEGCGPLGHATIACIYLAPQDYFLMVEAETPAVAGAYTLDVSSCSDPCGRAFLQDGTFANEDGSFTFVQTTDEDDAHTQYYDGPFIADQNACQQGMTEYGFGIYSWYDQDYGWKHIWPEYNSQNGVCIQSVQMIVCAYDVDQSDCSRDHPNDPQACELDHVFGDSSLLAPNYLQGVNGNWSATIFDVSPAAILDDGELNVFLDIDVYNRLCTWATAINYSQLVVRYRSTQCNRPPYIPELSGPACITGDSIVCIEAFGPIPADPDGDAVTYTYRWFVRNPETNGGFVDDETIGADHSGPCIPAADSDVGDEWLVEVYAVDINGTQSLEPAAYYFPIVTPGPCGPQNPPAYDLGDIFVEGCEGYPLGGPESGGPANPVATSNIAWLGESVTSEPLPMIPNLDDSDDGIQFMDMPWMPCTNVCVRVTISTGPGYNGQPLFLYGWKDGNMDCDWSDVLCDGVATECIISGEQILGMDASDSRQVEVCFIDPGVLNLGRYDGVLRFRLLSTDPGCEAAQSGVDELLGEVEDYVINDLQLDVELLTFGATHEPSLQDAGHIAVQWSTATESNNDHFDIERKIDHEWNRLGQVEGAGSSSETREYSFNDSDIDFGMTYSYRLVAVDINGNRVVQGETEVTVAAAPALEIITSYKLHGNFPNPFNPSTTIAFDLLAAGMTKLTIFDVLGREIAVLINDNMEAGRHRIEFRGDGLPSGLYFYRLDSGDFSEMRKMMLLK